MHSAKPRYDPNLRLSSNAKRLIAYLVTLGASLGIPSVAKYLSLPDGDSGLYWAASAAFGIVVAGSISMVLSIYRRNTARLRLLTWQLQEAFCGALERGVLKPAVVKDDSDEEKPSQN